MKPSGKLRLCIDPKPLNIALKRRHYPLPVVEDILPELSNVKVLSKADLKDGFLQCQLDEESSRLTTFQTPWGRYRYKRMPFGIKPAPEIFQQKVDECLENLKGVYKIADDIIITGKGSSQAEALRDHDTNLQNLLDTCVQKQIKLNYDKLEIRCDEITFMGHLLTNQGLKPDPKKVQSISDMPKPHDVPAVQRFIGMVKYLAKFLPMLSEISAPIRELTHKDTPWCWTSQHDEAFDKIKKLVTTAPILSYFDQSVPTEGQGDASQSGLGFVLMQNGHPITFSSRALTSAEVRYSQIEKELLAQVFGLERNNQYVYGRHIVLWTDHKPLVAITSKPLAKAPKRLQRLLIRLNQYDTEIRYMPGKDLVLADTLSRAYIDDVDQSTTEQEAESIHLTDTIRISDSTLTDIRDATAQDAACQQIMDYIQQGWPKRLSDSSVQTRPYFHLRDELSCQDGLIFKSDRCLIPQSKRGEIKQKLHAAHNGIQSTLRLARDTVYWPGITTELTDIVTKCDTCNTYLANQTKEPLISHPLPERPWQKLGCDIFTLDGIDYLVTVDYYSDFFEVDQLHKKDGPPIIKLLKRYSACHGIPDEVFTDNGPPFNSEQFSNFAKEYGFVHNTSSPTYPQSNGKSESAVKIAKSLIKKTKKANGDLQLNLLTWRNTPTEGLDSSPAQRLFGRRTKTNLPTASKLLKPKLVKDVTTKKQKKKEKTEKRYNKNAKPLEALKPGDTVRVNLTGKNAKWIKATVNEYCGHRSYRIITEDGRSFRRNRKNLIKTQEHYSNKQLDDEPMPTMHTPPAVRKSQRERRRPKYLSEYV